MPAPPRPPSARAAGRAVRAAAGACVLAAAVWLGVPAGGQPPKPADAAVKLPDGTIVFYTKSPDDPNPPVEGVYLTPAEFKALVDQGEQLKKLKAAAKPIAPSGCKVRGKVEARGDRTVAALTLTFSARTAAPRSVVLLGCQKGFPVAARLDDGRLPVLSYGDDGLSVLIDAPGEHTVTVELDVPVAARGTGRELGFEVGLPRAAITTLALDPPAGAKKLTVGVRTAADRDPRQTTGDPAAVAGRPEKPVALGPAELLAVSWDAPTADPAGPGTVTAAETEMAVRVSETQVESVATFRLRGAAKEWLLTLPPGADVVAAPASAPAPKDAPADPPFVTAPAGPTLVPPTDPAKPVWTFRPPDGPGPDWVLTATVRQPRPPAADAKHRGPYAVGPFAVTSAARQTGTVRVYAPPGVRLGAFKPGTGVRHQDGVPPEEDLVAVFRFTDVRGPGAVAAPAGPLLEFEARPAPVVVRVRPSHALTRTPAGWRLQTDARVTPPFRAEVEQVMIDVPPGWEGFEAGPPDLVEEVRVVGEGPTRRLAVTLTAGQRAPFDLTLTATFLSGSREAILPLPRFPTPADSAVKVVEQGATVTAAAPEGLEVRGTATTEDNPAPQDLRPPAGAKPGAATQVAGQFDKAVTRVDLTWQVHRPDLAADVRAEVTVQDRQLVVAQTVRLKSAEADARPILFRGPPASTGLRGTPTPEARGNGEWLFRPPADGAKEFTVSLSYALPVPPRRPDQSGPARVAVGLFWPEPATRVETTVRVWGGGSARRVVGFDGTWRDLPPEPAADRDALPWLTLAGSGANPPLALDLADPADGGVNGTTVDRALVQATVGGDGAVAVRGRFVLRRWSPAGVDLELPAGTVPEITVDGRKADPIATADAGESRVVRVPLPAPAAGRPGPVLDVRFTAAPVRAVRGELGQATLPAPRLPGAVFRSPPRWQVLVPQDDVPLFLGRDLMTDSRWAVRHGTVGPTAGATPAELEQWLAGGTEPGPDDLPAAGDAFTARQPVPGPVRLLLVPRVWWVGACSLAALVVGYGLARLRPVLLGPGLAVVGVAAAVAGVGWPQPTAQAAAAVQPGLLLLAVVLAGQALVKWYYRRRVTHLPGFTRTGAEPVGSGSAPAAPRSSQATGSAAVPLDGAGSQPPLVPTGS